jgi:hypothetical protein
MRQARFAHLAPVNNNTNQLTIRRVAIKRSEFAEDPIGRIKARTYQLWYHFQRCERGVARRAGLMQPYQSYDLNTECCD